MVVRSLQFSSEWRERGRAELLGPSGETLEKSQGRPCGVELGLYSPSM